MLTVLKYTIEKRKEEGISYKIIDIMAINSSVSNYDAA